jgi:hypothetical protein
MIPKASQIQNEAETMKGSASLHSIGNIGEKISTGLPAGVDRRAVVP